ncbi:bifunctional DNA primase/polymerase [Streptomyces sp. 891-h]|uniref:bifunctional DNA primase/polymerase n=1 Tax=Streptomyces sp. 891-h TaxID=2720714 RepID=UPI001FA9D1EE|nr:bifunctional DNA primase/polymerase [Streptomyces sp. 891-h]UNZ22310.1 bifunctional DNA primase/polymerase [Streptomyces sp. 891-h]
MTIAAAADLARRGLAVFPLPPGGRRPTGRWQSLCLTDPERVQELWCAGDNIGVGCRASKVVGLDLDIDGDGDGETVLTELATSLGQDWPKTLTVRTPSGGLHLYFRVPSGCTIGSSSGGRTALGSGIDVRGPGRRSGGYLVGPGSTVNGKRYVIERDVPLVGLPEWIAERAALV